MTYEEAESYINDTPKFTKKNTLENTRMVLEAMGHPERKMKLIHVAGSNGKGSVCAYLSSILKAAGKEVGLFTSPHLVKINERFKINEEDVSDELFLEAFEGVMDLVRQLLKEKPEEFAHPTFFELLFLMGIYIFDKAHMEYVVLETGLGGRFDATNVIEKPLVSVITSISLEHTEYLGDTYAKIAGEKAGIIKEGCPVVYDGTRKDVEEAILKKASEMHAKAYAAAGSDARMNGCELPVVINSGSGNQGMTCSLPVIIYAQELKVSKEKMFRALALSNLVAIHEKSGIGTLSAYCGAVSAATGAGAGIAYLYDEDYQAVIHTIVNTLANVSGIVCDGAKASCAAKIASSVDAAILGYHMYKNGQEFKSGDGLVMENVEATIQSVGRLGREGMRETNKEIIKMMIHE